MATCEDVVIINELAGLEDIDRDPNYSSLRPITSLRNKRPKIKNSGKTLPELTEPHLLETFRGSGITNGLAKSMAISLGIKQDRIASLMNNSLSGHPDCFAMLIVSEWIKMTDLSLKEAHKQLEKELRALNLNSSIPILQGTKRRDMPTVDFRVITVFLQNNSQDFTKEQAFLFGSKLELSKNKLEEIATEAQSNRGVDIVLTIFDFIQRSTTNFDDSKVDEVIDAWTEASSAHDIPKSSPVALTINMPKSTSSHQIKISSPSSNTVTMQFAASVVEGTSSFLRSAHETLTRFTSLKRSKERNKNDSNTCTKIKKKLVTKGILGTTIAMMLIMLIMILCFVIFPLLPAFEIQVALPTDVIKYRPSISSFWLSDIQLELIGSIGGECRAKAVSVKCANIQETTLNEIELIMTNTLPIYIKEGAVVTFIMSSEIDTPYFVWMFTSSTEANNNANNNFIQLACAQPPNNVWCIEVTKSNVFTVQTSSYYYIRCDRDPNCTLLDTIQINSTSYDFQLTSSYLVDSVVMQSGIRENLHLRKELISFDPDEVCILIELNETCDDQDIYYIDVNGTKRYDLLLLPSLFLCLLIIIIIAHACCVCCWRKKKKQIDNMPAEL